MTLAFKGLYRFDDFELDPARRAEIAAILREDDALAARVAAYSADRDALQRALGGIMAKPLPPSWQAQIEAATTRRGTLPRRRAVAAGIAVLLAIGAGGAAVFWPKGDNILEDALAVREHGLGTIIPVSGDAGAQNAQLAAAVGLHVRTPDLQHFGFRLAKLEIGGGKSAQLEYRDTSGRKLTIYIRPSDGTVRFDLLRTGGTRACVWQDDVVATVIIAPMSAGEMMRVASNAYAALNL